jgi:Gpi18-like mannosyltransferase
MKSRELFLSWLFFLVLVSELGFILIPIVGGFTNYRLPDVFNPIYGFANFDGLNYLGIVTNGYKALHIEAFFPGYPFLVRTVSYLTRYSFVAGLAVSLTCLYFSLKLIFEITAEWFDKKTALWTQIGLLTFPTSFFFAAVYSESLFLLISLLCFKYANQKKWLYASFFAFLSGIVRVNGIFLILMVALQFLTDWWKTKKISKLLAIWPLPLSTLGIGGYMYYLYQRFGDPLYFVHVQSFFNPQRDVSKVIFLHQVFYRYMRMMIYVDHRTFLFATVLIELICALFFIYLIIIGLKKLSLPMNVYSALVFLLPTLTGTFSSLPRYVLIMFPSFMIWGYLLARMPTRIRTAVLILSVLGLIVYEMMFIRGYFVA